MAKKLTVEEFIEKARFIHGYKYDYSKVIYINSYIHVIIICPIHGDFLQRPDAHLYGQGCPKCQHDDKRSNIKEFIKKAKEIHENKYDYSLAIYRSAIIKIDIKCNKCGMIFKQRPDTHLRGQGCPNCYKQIRALNHPTRLTLEEFIQKSIIVHGNLYGYDNFIYKDNNTKGYITCDIHDEFEQTPRSHLSGSGCPKCAITSKGEKALIRIFKKHNIDAKPQFKLPFHNFKYDFYLSEFNILIEFHGGQHYFPIDFFGGIVGYKKTIDRDSKKKSLAREYRIPIIYFTYKHFRMPKDKFEKFVLMIIDKVLTRKIIL